MNGKNKKLIIFKSDCNENEVPGDLCYVKFLDEEKNYAVFYKPLIAPKYFKEYLKENKIEQAYEITDDTLLENYQDRVYTFRDDGGVFKVNKGIELDEKLVLLANKGMEIALNFPKYSYELKGKSIIIKPYKKKRDSYCYVANENDVNEELRRIMIPVLEAVPGILNMGTYSFSEKTNKKILK